MTNETEGDKPIELLDHYGQPIPEWVKPTKEGAKRIDDEVRKLLRAPFPLEAMDQMTYGAKLTTIKSMYVVERLNDVFGIGRWVHHHTIVSLTKTEVVAKGRLEILDYDVVIPEQYGGAKIVTGDIASAMKGSVTNSLSKCASYLEIGIDVFKGQVSAGQLQTAKAKAVIDKNTQNEADKMIVEIKKLLNKKQPDMNGQTALKLFRDLTGLNWTSFTNIPLAQAKMGYTTLMANLNTNDR